MKSLPTRNSEKGNKFSIADFYEAGREKLQLSIVVGGKGLERIIEEPIVIVPVLRLPAFTTISPGDEFSSSAKAKWHI